MNHQNSNVRFTKSNVMVHHQRSISLKYGLQTEENMDGVHVFFILKVWTPSFNMDGVHVLFVLKDGRPGLTNLKKHGRASMFSSSKVWTARFNKFKKLGRPVFHWTSTFSEKIVQSSSIHNLQVPIICYTCD